jgi:hypothetical protein
MVMEDIFPLFNTRNSRLFQIVQQLVRFLYPFLSIPIAADKGGLKTRQWGSEQWLI